MSEQPDNPQRKSTDQPEPADTLFCPSAQPDWDQAMVFGVVQGTANEPRVSYLEQPLAPTPALLAQTSPVQPTEVLRIAAPCVGHACVHFDGSHCQLAARTIVHLQEVTEKLPPCSIRRSCRWWHEQGKAACQRCPQVVTDNFIPTDQILLAATPPKNA